MLNVCLDALLHYAVSIFCGVVIGINRERAGKEAGLKTHSIVCLGSTAVVYLITLLFFKYDVSVDTVTRAVAGVIQGVGFLGAGVILKTNNEKVIGLTTAASIWLTSAIGITCGTEYWYLAFMLTIIYTVLIYFESDYEKKHKRKVDLPQ